MSEKFLEDKESLVGIEPPYEDDRSLLLYYWSIIDLPHLTKEELLYTISFDFRSLEPWESEEFINAVIEAGHLIETEFGLKLNDELNKELKEWQVNRAKKIKEAIEKAKKEKTERIKNIVSVRKESTAFAVLFSNFADNKVMQRSLSVSREQIDLSIDKNNNIMGVIYGTNKYRYLIDSSNKMISHNCPDFIERRMRDNMFCKHLLRIFILLKRIDEELTKKLLVDMSLYTENWRFMG